MGYHKIGIDLGGTKTEAILLDPDDRELHRCRVITPKGNHYQGILKSVHQLILDTADHVPEGKAYTVGVGIPGSINSETRLVQNANTTCLINNPFQKDLEDLLGHPIGIENDANCFTLAETRLGAAKGCNMVFGIIMGTGCGGGICINGDIWRGPNDIAGEWGHFSVDPLGNECYCGNLGCVETKISGSGVETSFQKKYRERFTMEQIVQGFRKGDADCSAAFFQFLDDFGRCLGGLISVLDPEIVVLGGGLSNIDELYGPGMERVRHYAFHNRIQTPVVRNRLGDSAGVFGAAWIGR